MNTHIEKAFTVNSVHISEKTARLLEVQRPESLVIYPKDVHGWFISIPEPKELDYDELPLDLALLIGYAVGAGCQWLQIDRDAGFLTELPTYDW